MRRRPQLFDAAAPIVTSESLNRDRIFAASRYDKGGDDAYLNCPMNKEEYEHFYTELISAGRAPIHDFDVADPKVYEGCMPVEVMAQRGMDTLRFGPLKPVGLRDPNTGHRPWAVVQLRREDKLGTLYNLVGFQTNLKFGEQKRVFGMVPDLKTPSLPVMVSCIAIHFEFPTGTQFRLQSALQSEPVLCGADYGRRGLYGIRFFGSYGRNKCGAPIEWPKYMDPTRRHHDRGIKPLHCFRR